MDAMVIPLAAATGGLGPWAQVAISAAIFILLWQIISPLFFKPYLKMLIERESRTVGDEQAADAALKGTVETDKSIDDALKEARSSALKRREARLAEVKAQAEGIVSKAQQEADQELAGARAEIEKLLEDSRREMPPEIEVLSGQLVKKAVSSGSELN